MKRYAQHIAVLFIVALAACTTTAPQNPQQAVYAATATYDAALSIAVAYRRLPPCGPGIVPLCSQAEVIAKLQVADISANAAIMAAQRIVRDPKNTANASAAAVATAREALGVLTAITSTLNTGGSK